jgi:two-component system LytT family response regulator
MKAVVVEDHPEILEELVQLIRENCRGVELTGTATTVVAGAKLIRETHPDLIFLDIELPDGTGFDLLDILERSVRVIFITGSDTHAIRAFRYAAIDYLLKPVDPKELVEAVQLAQSGYKLDRERLNIYKTSFDNEEKVPDRIALHTQDKIHFIEVEDIMRCMADGNYTRFYLAGGISLLVAKTLKDYDRLLSAADFLRVHQSHLVNMKHVKEYIKTDGGYLVMQDGMKIPVSTRKKTEVLDYFDRIAHA